MPALSVSRSTVVGCARLEGAVRHLALCNRKCRNGDSRPAAINPSALSAGSASGAALIGDASRRVERGASSPDRQRQDSTAALRSGELIGCPPRRLSLLAVLALDRTRARLGRRVDRGVPAAAPAIDSRSNTGVTSDTAPAALRPELLAAGWDVEAGSRRQRLCFLRASPRSPTTTRLSRQSLGYGCRSESGSPPWPRSPRNYRISTPRQSSRAMPMGRG